MQLSTIRDYANKGANIFDMALKVVYYARVSTEKDAQLNSLQNQTQFFEEYIRNNPNWTFIDGYVDEGISGTTVHKRDSFMRMIEDAQRQRFDLIVTKEISRFSRNTLDSIKYIRLLRSYGVGVYFQNDNINTLDGDGELRLTIMAAIAQEEVNKLSKRTRFGFKKAQENGVLLGQNNLFGYNKENRVLTIVDNEAEIVRRVFNRYIEGKLGLRAIANELETDGVVGRNGKPLSYSSLCTMIRNPKYKGYYCGGKYSSVDYNDPRKIRVNPEDWIVYKDDRIPAIVDEATWEIANQLLCERGKLMKEHGDAYQQRYTYSGKLICAEHGTSYHRHVYKSKRRGEVECWNCKLYRLKGKVEGCDSPTIYSSELDEILSDIYRDLFAKRDEIIDEYLKEVEQVEAEMDYSNDIALLIKEHNNIEQKKEKILELIVDDVITKAEFKDRNDRLNAQLSDIDHKISELECQAKERGDVKQRMEKLRKLLEHQWDSNGEYNQEITAIVLDKIVVEKGEDKNHIGLNVYLKIGSEYKATIERQGRTNSSISLCQMGISQAQVSRLEKSALKHMKKYV